MDYTSYSAENNYSIGDKVIEGNVAYQVTDPLVKSSWKRLGTTNINIDDYLAFASYVDLLAEGN